MTGGYNTPVIDQGTSIYFGFTLLSVYFQTSGFDTELKMLSNIGARVIRAVVCGVNEMLVFTDLQTLNSILADTSQHKAQLGFTKTLFSFIASE